MPPLDFRGTMPRLTPAVMLALLRQSRRHVYYFAMPTRHAIACRAARQAHAIA